MAELDHPHEGLANLVEAVLLEVRPEVSPGTCLVVVTDFPFRSVGSRREFAAFVFGGVGVLSGQWAAGYRSTPAGGAEVRRVDLKTFGARRRVTLWAGEHTVGLELGYAELRAHTRGSVARQTGAGDWAYRDSVTGAEFDFHQPFPINLAELG